MRRVLLLVLFTVCVACPLMAQIDSVVVHNDRAAGYLSDGDLINAKRHYETALRFASDEMVAEKVALSVNLASVLIDLAEYSQANTCLATAESLIGADRERYGSLGQELDYQKAGLMMALGDSKGTVDLLEPLVKSLKVGDHLFMPVTRTLLDAYMEEKMFDRMMFRAEIVMLAADASDSLYLSRIMARAYARAGDKEEAMRNLSVSGSIHKRLPSDPIREVQQKRLCGELAEMFGDYQGAYESYMDAAGILSPLLGKGHPDCVSLAYGMAKTSFLAGDVTKAWKHYSEYLDDKKDYLSSQMFRMNIWEMQSYWKRSNEGLVDAPLFCHDAAVAPDKISKALNAVMFAKSVSFDTSVGFGEMVAKSDDESLKKDYQMLRHFRMAYNQNIRLNQKESKQNKQQADVLEGRIRKTLFDRGLLKDEMVYPDWKKVAAKMDPHSVAVEFVDFQLGDKWQYSAYIYRKGQKAPVYVHLCSEEELIANMGHPYLYNSTIGPSEACDKAFVALYDIIWKPLEQYFRSDDMIFFSPSGLIYNIPVEYLESGGVMFAERYPLVRRVSVTKDIPYLQTIKDIERIEAFGAVEYYAMDPSRYSDMSFKALEYAPDEIRNIEQIMGGLTTVNSHLGIHATEKAFGEMNLKPEGKALLHLSTHGYYCQYEQALAYPFYKSYGKDVLKTHSLLRCGLAMAGANRAWCGYPPLYEDTDGVLTAQEISEMDLRGASLVVLSACQTGLGDLGRDGVYGFQRAFRLAGAGSMMVSLWPVNDEVTMYMMKDFYQGLAAGDDAHKALVNAVRGVKNYCSSAYFYAPFVIMD